MLIRKKIKLLLLMLFMIAGLMLTLSGKTVRTARAFSGGPPAAHTGAPGELTCAECHGGSPNTGPGQFTISGLPAQYEPGMTYQVTVRHTTTQDSRRRWGFQLTALNSGDNAAGRLVNNTDFTQIVEQGGRQYIEHNFPGTFGGQSSQASWTFNWIAPATDAGPVTFYAAGNQANDNGTTTGDQIYTATVTVNAPALGPPRITNVAVEGKRLLVHGENFETGATLFMDEARVKKTFNDEVTPTTLLVARKAGKSIVRGQTIVLQVRNPSGSVTDNFTYTRPE